jgi:glycosyltransferase involved in cell wall biosynthesis
LRTVDRFLAVSEFVRRKHVQGGLPASKIRVKDNFVPAAVRRRGSGEFFLVVSRLSPEKGVTELVEAWRAIDHELVVAGDGPEMDKVAAKAPANVRLLGAVTPDRVQSLLQRARAVLGPSICYEGAPRVIPEAFAAGVPVIATRIGGLPNMVTHATNGYLVGLGQTREWKIAVDNLSDPSLNAAFGREAHRSWKARFTPEGAVRSLEEAYTR